MSFDLWAEKLLAFTGVIPTCDLVAPLNLYPTSFMLPNIAKGETVFVLPGEAVAVTVTSSELLTVLEPHVAFVLLVLLFGGGL
jgi:hypothetical protein